jgi:hypothetical protein
LKAAGKFQRILWLSLEIKKLLKAINNSSKSHHSLVVMV